MSNENTTTIHYVDAGSFYSVYGISTMIVLLLLMWYFIRTNLEHSHGRRSMHNCYVEGLGGIPIENPDIMKMMPLPDYEPIQLSEGEVKPYKHWGGMYGDVPLYIYDVKDLMYKPEWDHTKAIYVPNMRTVFKQNISNVE
jgi:hypothetical protein